MNPVPILIIIEYFKSEGVHCQLQYYIIFFKYCMKIQDARQIIISIIKYSYIYHQITPIASSCRRHSLNTGAQFIRWTMSTCLLYWKIELYIQLQLLMIKTGAGNILPFLQTTIEVQPQILECPRCSYTDTSNSISSIMCN